MTNWLLKVHSNCNICIKFSFYKDWWYDDIEHFIDFLSEPGEFGSRKTNLKHTMWIPFKKYLQGYKILLFRVSMSFHIAFLDIFALVRFLNSGNILHSSCRARISRHTFYYQHEVKTQKLKKNLWYLTIYYLLSPWEIEKKNLFILGTYFPLRWERLSTN